MITRTAIAIILLLTAIAVGNPPQSPARAPGAATTKEAPTR